MYYTKSQAAFTLSALKLFEDNPHVYFWTFTMRETVNDWTAVNQWQMFWKTLLDWHGKFLSGLRVTECHREHGLHFHALLAPRISVHVVRRCAKRYGIGRVHVVKADRGSILYLAKYLGKEKNLLKGARSWGTLGGFRAVTCRNIEVDSLFHRNMKRLTAGKRVHYLYARDVYNQTLMWGHSRNWQKSRQEPKRIYYLNPHTVFTPRRIEGVKETRWLDSYPSTVFHRKR